MELVIGLAVLVAIIAVIRYLSDHSGKGDDAEARDVRKGWPID